jgi:hypothetical protein
MSNITLREIEQKVKVPIANIKIQANNGNLVFHSNIDEGDSLIKAKENYIKDNEFRAIYFKSQGHTSSSNDIYGALTIADAEVLIDALQSMVKYIKN